MMSHTKWLNDEHTAIAIELDGTWQPDAFAAAERDLRDLLEDTAETVMVVIDIPNPHPIPMNMLADVRRLLTLPHPNRGQVVIVTAGSHLDAFREIIRRSFGGEMPAHLRITDTAP